MCSWRRTHWTWARRSATATSDGSRGRSRTIADGMIRKSAEPNAIDDIKGSVSRGEFFPGEPMRREKLVKGPNSGFLSAILPSGYPRGGDQHRQCGQRQRRRLRSAQRSRRRAPHLSRRRGRQAGGADVYRSETILTNVRVLAIGTNIQEKNGEHVVQGHTATLEVDSAPGRATRSRAARRPALAGAAQHGRCRPSRGRLVRHHPGQVAHDRSLRHCIA